MTEEKVFGRNEFMNPPKPEVTKVFCESLGAHVFMKKMSALDQDSYEWSLAEIVDRDDGTTEVKRHMIGMRLKYLVRVLSDEKGTRLFGDDEYTKLSGWGKDVIVELHRKALDFNGATTAAMRRTEKNSGTELTEDSHSG